MLGQVYVDNYLSRICYIYMFNTYIQRCAHNLVTYTKKYNSFGTSNTRVDEKICPMVYSFTLY